MRVTVDSVLVVQVAAADEYHVLRRKGWFSGI